MRDRLGCRTPLGCMVVGGTSALLMLLVLTVLWLGWTQSSGPVQQVAIDAAKVKCIIVKEGGWRFVMRDTDVIRRCVHEINSLAYTPYRPPRGLPVREQLALEDDDGNKIAGFGFTQDYCVCVFLPQSEPFYVPWGPLRTIGRLYSYGLYVTSREDLTLAAKSKAWDEQTIRGVLFCIRRIHSARPDLHLPEPSNPEELRDLVKTLPEARPDMLDQFPDYFR